MTEHRTHTAQHPHVHGNGCGHTAIRHNGHVDFIHDGHLHRHHADHVDECAVEVDAKNPVTCTPAHACGVHDPTHKHGEGCGHERVPHGDHVDYRVGGHLHHPHGNHCDDHGVLPGG